MEAVVADAVGAAGNFCLTDARVGGRTANRALGAAACRLTTEAFSCHFDGRFSCDVERLLARDLDGLVHAAARARADRQCEKRDEYAGLPRPNPEPD
jgi:hypothetical protein